MANRKTVNPVGTLISAGKVVSARANYVASNWHKPTPDVMQEINRMWSEKVFAFHNSCVQMAFASLELQQKLTSTAMQNDSMYDRLQYAEVENNWQELNKGVENVWQSGWQPIDNKVKANRKRFKV